MNFSSIGAVLAMTLSCSAVAGCTGIPLHIAAIEEMRQVRASPSALEAARLAPDAYAQAEKERAYAEQARESGDLVAASLHAQHAIASYARAFIIAREAEATLEAADAEKTLSEATLRSQALEESLRKLDSEADELEVRVRAVRNRLLPAPSGATTKEREAARAVAAQSLAASAHLLCGAAYLVTPTSVGEAHARLSSLDERLVSSQGRGLVDDAARARASCLDALTHARREKGEEPGSADALLAELSAAKGWDPSPDERGVVVVIHDAFGPDALLAPRTVDRLTELGHIAAAHPGLGIQVVVHDATVRPPSEHRDGARADAVAHALVAAGVAAERIQKMLPGAKLPLLDPGDKTASSRNERIEIAFIH